MAILYNILVHGSAEYLKNKNVTKDPTAERRMTFESQTDSSNDNRISSRNEVFVISDDESDSNEFQETSDFNYGNAVPEATVQHVPTTSTNKDPTMEGRMTVQSKTDSFNDSCIRSRNEVIVISDDESDSNEFQGTSNFYYEKTVPEETVQRVPTTSINDSTTEGRMTVQSKTSSFNGSCIRSRNEVIVISDDESDSNEFQGTSNFYYEKTVPEETVQHVPTTSIKDSATEGRMTVQSKTSSFNGSCISSRNAVIVISDDESDSNELQETSDFDREKTVPDETVQHAPTTSTNIPTNTSVIRFKCQFCVHHFPSKYILDIHIQEKHLEKFNNNPNEIYQTQENGTENKTALASLRLKLLRSNGVWNSTTDYLKSLEDTNEFMCPICNRSFSKKRYLKRHAVRCGRGSARIKSNKSAISPPRALSMCKKSLQTTVLKSKDRVDDKLNRNAVEFKASTSGTEAKSNDAKKSLNSLRCSTCSVDFSSTDLLYNHQIEHKVSRPFTCEFGTRTFPTKGSHMNHEKVHNSNSTVVVNTDCGGGKVRREKKRVKQEPFTTTAVWNVCSFCNKQYIYLGALKTHLRKVHNFEEIENINTKPNASTSRDTNNKVEHITVNNVMISNKNINCEYCNKVCSSPGVLQLHLSASPACCGYYMRNN